MIRRDFNHPSVFSWIPFNETWGLYTNVPEGGPGEAGEGLQAGDAAVGGLRLPAGEVARSDPAGRRQLGLLREGPHRDRPQLVACLPARVGLGRRARQEQPGHAARLDVEFREPATSRTASPTSTASSATSGATKARRATWIGAGTTTAPSTRSAVIPQVAGWLYTEHHDVINEWNGYWRFDRSEKFTGMDDLAGGMTLRDLHAPLYVAVGTPADLSRSVKAGETVDVPLWASFLTGEHRLRRRPPAADAPRFVEQPGPEADDLHHEQAGRVPSLDVRGAAAACRCRCRPSRAWPSSPSP